MTVSTTYAPIAYTGNGVTTDFATGWEFPEETDIVVLLDGVEKTLTTHYTVSGAGNESGGTVTMLTAPPPGASLVIYRNVAADQDRDFVNNASFDVEEVEAAFDKLTMVAQQNESASERAIRIPDADTGFTASDLELPVAAARVNKYLSFDSNGKAEVVALPSSLTGTDGSWVVATISVLRGVTGSADQGAFVLRYDTPDTNGAGGGAFRWADSGVAGTYTDNSSTIIVPTGGDGSAAWLRVDSALDTYSGLRSADGGHARYVLGRNSVNDGDGGLFYWDGFDLSTEVAADPGEDTYVAPDSDNTGASGAWVRVSTPADQTFTITTHTGDGSTAAFTHNGSGVKARYLIFVDGTPQPPAGYSVTSTTVTFGVGYIPINGQGIFIASI